MTTIAYLKLAILDYVERQVSSRKSADERGLTQLLERLEIVSELSRLGRSLGQIIQTIDELVKSKIHGVAEPPT